MLWRFKKRCGKVRGAGNQPRSHCSALLSSIFLQPSSSWCCCCCCCARNMCVGRKLERSSKSWRKWQMGAEVMYVGLYLCICTCTARCSCCCACRVCYFPSARASSYLSSSSIFFPFFFSFKKPFGGWVCACIFMRICLHSWWCASSNSNKNTLWVRASRISPQRSTPAPLNHHLTPG